MTDDNSLPAPILFNPFRNLGMLQFDAKQVQRRSGNGGISREDAEAWFEALQEEITRRRSHPHEHQFATNEDDCLWCGEDPFL